MTVDPHMLAAAASEAEVALDHGWLTAEQAEHEARRADRYGHVERPQPPTFGQLLQDDEGAAAALAITPQPETARCPTCAGTGRVRQEAAR